MKFFADGTGAIGSEAFRYEQKTDKDLILRFDKGSTAVEFRLEGQELTMNLFDQPETYTKVADGH